MCDELTLDMEADAEMTAERMEREGCVSCEYCGEYGEIDEMLEGKGKYCCQICFDNHDHDENCDCGGFADETLDHEFSSEREEQEFNQAIRKEIYENLRWNQDQEASEETEARKKEAVTVSAATA